MIRVSHRPWLLSVSKHIPGASDTHPSVIAQRNSPFMKKIPIPSPTLHFRQLGGTSQIEQPGIEFLATNKFVITQTGSRILTGLQVSWKGAAGTYESGMKHSDLFGDAIQIAASSSLYIDVSDSSLSFTGTNNNLGAFTMGAYFWRPALNNKVWFLMVPHNAQFTSDLLFDSTKWRLAMFLWQSSAEQGSLTYSTAAGNNDWTTHLFYVPSALRAGWIHLAHTYNPSESGGTLRSYVNGIEALVRTNLGMRVYGSQGAYATFPY